jgi:GTP diphosphokinase / guanosine-3',5'-bis(diphosphate) 3'-diphosphatase
MDRLLSACLFAADKHKTQKRKDKNSTPYINHPIHVSCLMSEAGVTDVDILIAGLLHDTIEDTKTSNEEIAQLFGENVLKIVLECSDDKTLPKEKRKQLQLEHAADVSMGAKMVKLADKYSNLSDLLENPPKSWSEKEINGYAIWVYAVYQKLKGINKVFDDKFTKLFDKFKISGTNQEEINKQLEEYYGNIKNSD